MRKLPLSILLAASLAVAAPGAAQDIGDIVQGVAKSLITQEMDQNAFREAQRLNSANAYRNYLNQYPRGAQRAAAEQALARFGGTADDDRPLPASGATTTSAGVEAALGLTRAQRTQIQRQLTSLGYASGVADGLWGANTRTAIRSWQTANKLPATGYVTSRQVNLIAQQSGPVAGTNPTQPAIADDQVEERLLGLTLTERREIQRRLTRLGYPTRGVDGAFGRNTRRALADWQSDEGLRATGYITADQLRELRVQTAG